MQSGPYVKRVLSSSRWMAAARPATGLHLLLPVLTPELSHSPLLMVVRAFGVLAESSVRACGLCGPMASSPEETGRWEHVRDLDRRPLACCSVYPPLT